MPNEKSVSAHNVFGQLVSRCRASAPLTVAVVISRRHERKSTVISTNLAFKQWSAVFPNAACVGALVDRFAQHCLTMDIDADSWRQKMAAEPPAASPKRTPKKTL